MTTDPFIALTGILGVSATGFGGRDPEIAALVGGGYVIAWDVDQADGSGKAVYARVYDENFQAVGPDFRVNEHSARDQDDPKIVARADGGFDIFFESEGLIDSATNTWAIEPGRYVRSYDAAGTAETGEVFLARTHEPYLTQLQSGQFMEIYSYRYYSNQSIVTDVYGRLLDTSYQPTGANFKINSQALGDDLMDVGITTLNGGNVVAIWSDDGIHGTGTGVWGQILTPTGAKVGGQFLVNTYTAGRQIEPRMTVLKNGNFVVTWKSGYGQDGSDWGQFGQVFTAAGTKVGTEFQVNTVTYGVQYQGTPVALEGGGFVIVYLAGHYLTATDSAVLAQLFDGTGNKIGGAVEVAVIDAVPDNEFYMEPRAVALEGGGFAVTWAGGNTPDLIYTRVFAESETGTTGADAMTGSNAREFIDGAAGDDTISGAGGDDTLVGGDGADRISAGGGDDLVVGGSQADVVFGGAGAEVLTGSANADTIIGGAGDDTIMGGSGNDMLIGGSDADTFVFGDSFGADTIADWQNGVDRLTFDGVSGVNGFQDLVVTSVQGGSEITLVAGGSESIFLIGVSAAQIDASDFDFV